jgi:hypothetical protein
VTGLHRELFGDRTERERREVGESADDQDGGLLHHQSLGRDRRRLAHEVSQVSSSHGLEPAEEHRHERANLDPTIRRLLDQGQLLVALEAGGKHHAASRP